MKLNEKELAQLPIADALTLRAYVEALESIKEYQDKIDSLDQTQEMSIKLLNVIKETHENYAELLLHILAEQPTIKNAIVDEKPKPKKKKILIEA